MNLLELVHVNTNYTRSINIERDSEQVDVVRPYVITARAKQILERIVGTLKGEDMPRAWALIGPYGAGKSAFGLFLSHIFSAPDSAGNKYAAKALKESDPKLHAAYQKYQRGGRGFCCVALTGSPEPLAQRLLSAMLPAAEEFFRGRVGRSPNIIKELRNAQAAGSGGASQIIALLTQLQESVSHAGGRGVLIVIDELGKFLEYEARHRGATDIFLLQALAEHSVSKGAVPLVLVVLLHQAIELYAQSLGEQLKNEWKKVQGRFETIPFLESTEQTLRVVKAAIALNLPKGLKATVREEAGRISKRLAEIGALPTGLPVAEAQELFLSCYPLHPISLLILPTLCQRVAQNERTLFSYLGSHEPHGFSDSISRIAFKGQQDGVEWIRPHEIYEYFILNQPGLMSDQGTHRRWAEVITALERLGDAPAVEGEFLKTVGLLNIIGAQGGLKASNEVLSLCLRKNSESSEAAKKVAQPLIARSIITYRKFNHEYRVWQGSDFDLEIATRDQRAQIGKVESAAILNELMPLSAIVARRHAIETGTLRYFSPVFVGVESAARIGWRDAPTIFVCLAESPDEFDVYRKCAERLEGEHSVAVLCGAGAAIKDAVLDVQALQRVQRQNAELSNDPVAQRELKDRLATATKTQRELVESIFEDPEQWEWLFAGTREAISNKRELQIKLSALLDRAYAKAPIVRNELINRDRASSTAISARKKLLMAMLERSESEDLGIEKFPAEKAMYRAILRATGLHVHQGDKWRFQQPGEGQSDRFRFRPAWDAIMVLLASRNGAPMPLAEIYGVLSKPPYGIRTALLPILSIAMFQSMREELALTEHGQFVPFLTREVLEGLIKSPDSYALQRFRLDIGRNRVFEQYAEAITGETPRDANLMSVLQPLAKLLVGLPDYTKQTKRITVDARAVRDLFFASKTPAELIFFEYPKVLGVDLILDDGDTQAHREFVRKFKSALAELRVAYHGLLYDLVEMIKAAFGLDPKLGLAETRDVLRGRCSGLGTYTIDPQCTAFIGRLVDPFGDESQWLVSLGSFLTRKPPEKWIDDDVAGAQFRLKEFSARVRDLRQLQLHYEDAKNVRQGDLEASLIRIVSTRDGERQVLVTLDEQGRGAVKDRVIDVKRLLDSLPSDELKLATLAQVVKDLISNEKSQSGRPDSFENKIDKIGAA